MRRLTSPTVALLALVLVIPTLALTRPASAANDDPPSLPVVGRSPNADFFGVVGRDPYYEWNTDRTRFPDDVNRAALEGMARDLANAGAGWIRIEIRAQHDSARQGGPGYIDYRKWDWFIRECAPKYGLKVLLLLGTGILDDNRVDPAVSFARINDPPDRPDGTNGYIRLYTARAKEIADHYGDAVAAYEVLNEPNISAVLQFDTEGRQMEVAPERFGALLAETYGAIKPAHPRQQLVIGGLLFGPRAAGATADFDYLYVLYRSSRVQQYRAANGRYPFDGIGVHAYFLDQPRKIVDHLWALRGLVAEAGDTSKLWLTEIGLEAPPPLLDPSYLIAAPTSSETAQATFIRGLFPLLLRETRGFVANVFWFKYEDFPSLDGWANYGLVRLPITTGGSYVPPPWPRKLAYEAYQEVAHPAALPTAPEPPTSAPGSAYFAETRHTVSGSFLTYWQNQGGLARFGFPLTSVFELGGLRVQYFERARFEYHPDYPAGQRVELGLLTGYLTRDRTFPRATPFVPAPTPTPSPSPTPTRSPLGGTATASPPGTAIPTMTPSPTEASSVYFPQTGQNLGGEFLRYWKARGGLASFGYPISEELREVSQADGRTYTVQYFERARFEFHPELAGTDYVVLLGLMGWEAMTTGGWYR